MRRRELRCGAWERGSIVLRREGAAAEIARDRLSNYRLTRGVRAFHQGLSETGFVEGQNLAIEYRGIDGRHYGRLAAPGGHHDFCRWRPCRKSMGVRPSSARAVPAPATIRAADAPAVNVSFIRHLAGYGNVWGLSVSLRHLDF